MLVKTKLKLITILLLGLGSLRLTFAQESTINVYGILDVGIANITNSENASKGLSPLTPGATYTGFANGGLTASRWGIVGKEEISGNLTATFTLESSLFPSSGDAGATGTKGSDNYSGTVSTGATSLFNREATIGLLGGWGSLKIGRDRTIAYEKAGLFDPASTGQGLSNFGGIGSFGVYNLSRANNQLKYYSPVFSGVQLGLAYSTQGVPVNFNTGNTKELYLGYKNSGWNLFAAFQETTTFKDSTSGNTSFDAYYGGGTSTSAMNPGATALQVWQFGVEGNVGVIKLNVGFDSRRDLSATSSSPNIGATPSSPVSSVNVFYVGAGYQIEPNQKVTLAVYREQDNRYSGGNVATMVTGQYVLQLSKRTSLYGIVSEVNNGSCTYITVTDNANIFVSSASNTGSTPQAGDNQFGLMLGVIHQF